MKLEERMRNPIDRTKADDTTIFTGQNFTVYLVIKDKIKRCTNLSRIDFELNMDSISGNLVFQLFDTDPLLANDIQLNESFDLVIAGVKPHKASTATLKGIRIKKLKYGWSDNDLGNEVGATFEAVQYEPWAPTHVFSEEIGPDVWRPYKDKKESNEKVMYSQYEVLNEEYYNEDGTTSHH